MKFDDIQFNEINLPNHGIYQIPLEKSDIDNLYTIVKKYSPKEVVWEDNTITRIDSKCQQWGLFDDNKTFQTNVLEKILHKYLQTYKTPVEFLTTHAHRFTFNRFWCNATTKGQYQALHNHDAIFSFVIWLEIPYDMDDERAIQDQMHPQAGEFGFVYTDITGRVRTKSLEQSKCHSGTMLFFPSTTNHNVYPFYSTDEVRISCSGDISLASQFIHGSLNPPMFDLPGKCGIPPQELERLNSYNSQEMVVSDPLFPHLNQHDIDRLCSSMGQSESYQHT